MDKLLRTQYTGRKEYTDKIPILLHIASLLFNRDIHIQEYRMLMLGDEGPYKGSAECWA